MTCAKCGRAYQPKRRFKRSRFCGAKCRRAAWRMTRVATKARECVPMRSSERPAPVWTPDPSFYRPAVPASWLLLRFDWFEEQTESEAWR